MEEHNKNQPTSDKKSVIKQFGLTTLSIKNRITVFVITFLIILFGWNAYQTIAQGQLS